MEKLSSPSKDNPIQFGGKEYTDKFELIADLELLIKQLNPKRKGTVLNSYYKPHRKKITVPK